MIEELKEMFNSQEIEKAWRTSKGKRAKCDRYCTRHHAESQDVGYTAPCGITHNNEQRRKEMANERMT